MNQLMIVGGIVLIVVIVLVIKLIIYTGNGEKTKKLEPASVKPKMAYGKIWKWVTIISIIIALGVTGLIILPKYLKKDLGQGGKVASKKVSISASLTWAKKPHQLGIDPKKRFGGPYRVVITRDDPIDHPDASFCFTLYGEKSEAKFYGKKKKGGKIEGWWEQPNPRSDGKWILKKDQDDSNLYKGIITDKYLPEGVDTELRIKF